MNMRSLMLGVMIMAVDMFVAASNGTLKHFMTILTNFMKSLRMWGKLSSTATGRTAEALDVLDGIKTTYMRRATQPPKHLSCKVASMPGWRNSATTQTWLTEILLAQAES